jgi:hypothetical protein
MLMSMFKRRGGDVVESNACPYCEFNNAAGVSTCVQCYYEMEKSARDQGESVSPEISSSIFDELMSEEDDSWDDTEALDVVLTMDQDPLVVDQYETTDFSSEEPEKIGFMDSRAPELHTTVIHQVEDVSIEDVGEAPKDYSKIDLTGHDPLAEVAEPVHSGRGAVFSPQSPKMDDDLLGHIGGSELPSLPPDDLYNNKVDLTGQGAPPPPAPIVQVPVPEVVKAPAPTPAIALPESPIIHSPIEEPTPAPTPAIALPESPIIQSPAEEPTPAPTPAIALPESPIIQSPAEEPTPAPTPAIALPESPIIQSPVEEPTPEPVEEPTPEPAEEPTPEPAEEPTPAPEPEDDGRFWPWPAAEPWDPRQIHREVVSALEDAKSGKIDSASRTIEELGPHLDDANVDLLYHVGLVLKQIGRENDVSWMLARAHSALPESEHVSSAVAHLGVN